MGCQTSKYNNKKTNSIFKKNKYFNKESSLDSDSSTQIADSNKSSPTLEPQNPLKDNYMQQLYQNNQLDRSIEDFQNLNEDDFQEIDINILDEILFPKTQIQGDTDLWSKTLTHQSAKLSIFSKYQQKKN
ncbi:hypothetical protein PPERSA_08647 [Pseudocohnilembus persalinus]|uniref:Uncharacterized protein n=1 Tax=Pseudocohnilembus persalinus TaxID=266149 RepID=A0A0V0Q8A0_PSEPJ|nr:hypothetical protein PPERSA_08647 [Pseudocohnilembus persalinus]|eukprot:KRW98422.1 hypothetical protein PPERSA_08647 [Pseudocohnilembus persalinus]